MKINAKVAAAMVALSRKRPTRRERGLEPIRGSKACKCGKTISANKDACLSCKESKAA